MKTHWVSGEQAISKQTVTKIREQIDGMEPYSAVLIYPSTIQIKQALMDQNALQVIYHDKTLKTIYLGNPSQDDLNGTDFRIDLK